MSALGQKQTSAHLLNHLIGASKLDRPGRREAAYRHGCCLMQNKINDLNLLYD
jgi:hypothetical protein